MERDKESPLLGYPTNGDDLKYVSSLSTILVATIQEAKDRISQVEYIFCSQLFPNFQSKSKCLQKVYLEARKAAEDEWKEKEHDLLLQIKNLQLEKQLIFEENQSFEMEKLKFLNQQESFQENLLGLKEELKQKTEEIEKLREMQLNMVKALEAKSSLMANNEKIMKQLEEKNRNLIAKYETLEKTVDIIEEQLNQKAKEVDTEKDLKKKLLEDIESLRLQKYDYEQILNRSETEKKQLEDQLHILEGTIVGLQKEPCKKTEVAAGKKFQEQLLQQIDLHNSEMSKNRQQVEEYEKEKKLHLAKIKSLEDRIDKFRVDLREKVEVTTEGIQLHKKLLEQIEAKNSELFSEKKKRKDMIASYKSLKSQFNYLCTKFNFDTESLPPDNRMDNDSSSLREDPNPSTSPAPNASIVACNSIKEEIHEDTKGMRSIQRSSSNSPSGANNPGPNQRGTKRPGSSWRDTRSHQRRNGPDPHDDFLDTPLECIRENMKNPLKEEVHNPPDPVPHEMNFESLDDETQDLGGNPVKQNPQMPAPRPAMNGFKYVEPVRKKADRENLKGIECNQCRKFYDAVLPDDGGDGNKQQLRCEHHQGVSRHRYRYAPPSTPEGFWNIGFESEM